MGILTQFTSPQDVRWRGTHHHLIFFIKSVLLIPFIVLVIVEYALFKSWWEEDGTYYTHYDWEWAPYHFWLRIGMALVPDVLVTIASLVLVLNPMHYATYAFHPVFALVSSFVVMAMYVQVCWLNPLSALSNEVAFYNSDAWERIVFAETAFESIICILYIIMMVYSCVAVHRWRMAKKSRVVRMGRLDGHEVGGNAV